MNILNLHRQKGILLMESLLAVLVAVTVSVGLLSYVKNKTDDNKQLESDRSLQRANDSLLAYIFLNSKLPCPAPITNGIASDDCSKVNGKISGYFPYKTVGLPDFRTGKIIYNINNGIDGSLSLTQVDDDSLKILSVSKEKTIIVPPSVIAESKGLNITSDGFLNFCAALVSSQETKNLLAFELLHKDTNFISSNINDLFITTRSNLSQKYNCTSLLSGASRSHANTSLASHMMYFSSRDLSEYFGIISERTNLLLAGSLITFKFKILSDLTKVLTKKAALTADATSVATSTPLTAALKTVKDLNMALTEVQSYLGYYQSVQSLVVSAISVTIALLRLERSIVIRDSIEKFNESIDENLLNNIFLGLEIQKGSLNPTQSP